MMPQHKPLYEQAILACPVCGAPNAACEPLRHNKGVARMSKARAAALAIRETIEQLDNKTRATGEREP